MKRFRSIFFLSIIFAISFVIVIYIQQTPKSPFPSSLAPLFLELGKPIKTVDRVISRTLPIDEIDEKELGDEIKLKFSTVVSQCDEVSIEYLNSLVQSFNDETHKPFQYTVFLVKGPPNASALPGGVICITTGLLELLENEAELVAILGHEIGHIERGHLFDAARGEMLRRKTNMGSYPFYASQCLQLMMDLTFSKSQENEADEYGFRLLVKKKYDPFALSSSFKKMDAYFAHVQQPPSILDDFFATHPHDKHRAEKFHSRAQLWINHHPQEKWYVGKKNYANHISQFEMDYPDEWIEKAGDVT
ncbi:MAG: Metalloprotease LoiP [Chlamydiae bacterium]|nr:Metalloprotease LoiP [Chlamydiota bacterium]